MKLFYCKLIKKYPKDNPTEEADEHISRFIQGRGLSAFFKLNLMTL